MASTSLDSYALFMQQFTVVEERIARLERHNRLLTMALGGMVIACGIAMALGMQQSQPEAIDAREFRLLDDQGKPRARLAMLETGPALVFMDADANSRLKLALDDVDGPALFMTDHNHSDRITLRVQPTGATLAVGDENGAERVRLATSEIGASIGLFDAQLKNRARLALDQTGLPTLHFFTPNALPMLSLIATEKGPSLAMNDLHGHHVWCMPEGSQKEAAEQAEAKAE